MRMTAQMWTTKTLNWMLLINGYDRGYSRHLFNLEATARHLFVWKPQKTLIDNIAFLPGRLRLSILPVMLSESSSPYDSRGGSAMARALQFKR